jgi:hypothetical protein
MTANVCLWPGYVNQKDIVLREVPCADGQDAVPIRPWRAFEPPALAELAPARRIPPLASVDDPPPDRRSPPFEAPPVEPPRNARRQLPDSVDAPPVTRHAPQVEAPPIEPPRRVIRQLPDSVDAPPVTRHAPQVEAPPIEPPRRVIRQLPDSVDAPPVTRHAPQVEAPLIEPPRRVVRQLPDSVDAPPVTRHAPLADTPPSFAVARRLVLLPPEAVDVVLFALQRRSLDEGFRPELRRRAVLPPPSVVPPKPRKPRRRPRGGGGIGARRSKDIELFDHYDLEALAEDLLAQDDDEHLDARSNAFWKRTRSQTHDDAARAFHELRQRLIARDQSQSAIIGALSERLERETAQARVLWLALATGVGTALVTKKPLPTIIALALAVAVGRLVFRPAPLRVYLWVTAPASVAGVLTPPRVLSEPVVLSEAEAEHVSRELGPGAIQLEFDGQSWVPAQKLG